MLNRDAVNADTRARVKRAKDIGEVVAIAKDGFSCDVEITRRNGRSFVLENVLIYAEGWGPDSGVIDYRIPQVRAEDNSHPGETVIIEYAEGGTNTTAYIIGSLPGLGANAYQDARNIRQQAQELANAPLSKVIIAKNSAILMSAYSDDGSQAQVLIG